MSPSSGSTSCRPRQERPLGAALGPVVHAAAARTALGAPVRLPKLEGAAALHLRDRVVSVVLATPRPVLLSEFRDGVFLLKKIAGSSTHVVYVKLGNGPGLWIAGAVTCSRCPTRRRAWPGTCSSGSSARSRTGSKGERLTKQTALELAAEIDGT